MTVGKKSTDATHAVGEEVCAGVGTVRPQCAPRVLVTPVHAMGQQQDLSCTVNLQN